jgi:hypothetical protein
MLPLPHGGGIPVDTIANFAYILSRMENLSSPSPSPLVGYNTPSTQKVASNGMPYGRTTLKEFVAPTGYVIKVDRNVYENYRGNTRLNVEYVTCGVSFKTLKRAIAYAEQALAEWV